MRLSVTTQISYCTNPIEQDVIGSTFKPCEIAWIFAWYLGSSKAA